MLTRAPLTKTQLDAADRHQRFHRAIALRARPDIPLSCLSASQRSMGAPVEPAPAASPALPETMLPKPLWFGIECEIRRPVAAIKQIVCDHFSVRMADLNSQRRDRRVLWPRQIAIYLVKVSTSLSLPAIGRRFGNRDHTTILHSCRRVEEEMAKSSPLRDLLADLQARIPS